MVYQNFVLEESMKLELMMFELMVQFSLHFKLIVLVKFQRIEQRLYNTYLVYYLRH